MYTSIQKVHYVGFAYRSFSKDDRLSGRSKPQTEPKTSMNRDSATPAALGSCTGRSVAFTSPSFPPFQLFLSAFRRPARSTQTSDFCEPLGVTQFHEAVNSFCNFCIFQNGEFQMSEHTMALLLNLLVGLRPNPHLWSRTLGQDRKNEFANTSGQNECLP